jgi:hypothetical protein
MTSATASFSTIHFLFYIAIIPLPFCTTLLGSGGRGREDGGGGGDLPPLFFRSARAGGPLLPGPGKSFRPSSEKTPQMDTARC